MPVVFAYDWYSNFEASAKYGTQHIAETPEKGRDYWQASHVVIAVGWDDSKQCFGVQNSYGQN